MDSETLVRYLDRPDAAADWLRTWGIENVERAHANLIGLAKAGITLDLLVVVCEQLEQTLPKLSDPDMALNNLERFVVATRNPLSLGGLFERDREALPTLLQIFSNSQYLSDWLIRDPESYDLLRLTEGQPVVREILTREVCSEAAAVPDERHVLALLRRYKHRETLRIAYGDIVRRQPLEVVTRQISYLADASAEAALQTARRTLEAKRGVPRLADGRRGRFAVIALGKLGGCELNYSSDVDFVFISDGEGKTDGDRPLSNQEFFDRLARGIVKLLTDQTELGVAYRVDLRLRPEGEQGPAVVSIDNALRYYDLYGRTWERQAYVKARTVAGDLDLGEQFLSQLQPWIYRRYLSRADIAGIKALKRRIEQRAFREGGDTRNVKTGHGGIRDIEFVIQFLQLLNGGDLPKLRTGNTLEAIAALEQEGCLTWQERSLLEENYSFLRRLEHRLQIMFDLQTHTLPESDAELRRVAIRMGYTDKPPGAALAQFKADFRSKTELNRKILDHLLHDAFGDDEVLEPETELVFDPEPSDETIKSVFSKYRFRDVRDAYTNLMALGTEKIPFLSTRRCRHFLASIAPKLLKAIAATPDPDATLVSLSKVSDSLGGKGVLWELFSFNPPSLKLYVQLCASSPYLSGILTSNPGMLDELMDSLVLNKLPTQEWLTATLTELCRGAQDIEPILHSFKNSQHLRVGVRDILGKEDIQAAHRALSDIAEVCLDEIIRREYIRLVEKHGEPTVGSENGDTGKRSDFVLLALGKLGGREPNYHSDLDVVFLYTGEGSTRALRPSQRNNITTNQHFFGQLGQRIIKVVTQLGPFGRLYEMDVRLRPTGRSGTLAVSLEEFVKYFDEGQGQLWERQALCKARPISGSAEAQQRVMTAVRHCIVALGWNPGHAREIRAMRQRLEETASTRNLKRGPGGTVDIEFAVQVLQLRHAAETPEVLVPGTLNAIAALHHASYLSEADAIYWSRSYRFLRSIESGLRLMNTSARHDLPEAPAEMGKLAFLLGYDDAQSLVADCLKYTRENRLRFDAMMRTMMEDGVGVERVSEGASG
jgi:glutamate-ammonia-ligase adenylyltransferase